MAARIAKTARQKTAAPRLPRPALPRAGVRTRITNPASHTLTDQNLPAEEVRRTLDAAVNQVAPTALVPSKETAKISPSLSPKPDDATSVLPVRMLNEFVYCPRLFYYEFVEGLFVHNADTLHGRSLHTRVDNGSGAMPPAVRQQTSVADVGNGDGKPVVEEEVIHSRSVALSSERLGVTAKMDLVEAHLSPSESDAALGELFARSQVTEVCPVDYKAGSPREGDEGKELWDTDKIQLGLQCLILRDNGYTCNEGIIYYRGTKQRVRLSMTTELEGWILAKIAAARATAHGPIPPPLDASPKCVRCSLAPVCLPDETSFLQQGSESITEEKQTQNARATSAAALPRRLMAPREERRALYLNTPGLHLGRSNEVLQVREKKQVIEEFRMSNVCHVALFGNIQISIQAVQALCSADIPVTYFSMGGWFYGITRGHSLKNVFLRIEQFRLAAAPQACLRLARTFVRGKIRNHRTLLMRNHVEPPPHVLLRLKTAADDALRATSIEELLGIEGAAAALYFKNFAGMIKVETGDTLFPDDPVSASPDAGFTFDFSRRNRRPPTDPVNALLSLAYSLLAKDCTLAAYAVGFDPYVGYYHQPRFGRPALALDLMEEFRPLIAESVVITAINNRMITTDDFIRAGDAVNLSPAGRRQFFNAYEQRMNHLITHPLFDYKVSYRRALELQFRILARTLTGEIPAYIPFTTR